MDGASDQLALFDSALVLPEYEPGRKYGHKKRGGYVPKYEVTDAIRQMGEVLDRIHADFADLQPYEGRCPAAAR